MFLLLFNPFHGKPLETTGEYNAAAAFWFIHIFISFCMDVCVCWILAFQTMRTGYFKKTMIALALTFLCPLSLERFACLTCGFLDNLSENDADLLGVSTLIKMGA